MEDKLIKAMFDPERWHKALEHGTDKGITTAVLTSLVRPEVRAALYVAMRDGKYAIAPPHTALKRKRRI